MFVDRQVLKADFMATTCLLVCQINCQQPQERKKRATTTKKCENALFVQMTLEVSCFRHSSIYYQAIQLTCTRAGGGTTIPCHHEREKRRRCCFGARKSFDVILQDGIENLESYFRIGLRYARLDLSSPSTQKLMFLQKITETANEASIFDHDKRQYWYW
jgi:hypothetical protein